MTTTPPEPTPGATTPDATTPDATTPDDTRADTQAQPDASAPTRTADEPKDPLRGSRTSGAWIGLAVVAILLVLLIIFIAQNTQKVQVAFLGWEGQTPLAVALLAAVVTGLVVAAIAGSLRILQLRRRVKRSAR